MSKKIVIVGAGVAGITASTNLIDQGFNPKDITIIDKGKDAFNRPEDEVMEGFAGCGLFSDGKYSYLHNAVGGHLAKYFGEEKSDELNERSLNMLLRFHPDPSQVVTSNPIEEPEFIKPYFSLRMASNKHVGTDYLHETGKNWNKWLIEKGVNFMWETEITDIDFPDQIVYYRIPSNTPFPSESFRGIPFDKLIYCTGKSGIDLTQNLIDKYDLEKEPKSVQIGVRFLAPQHYFQNILDIAYDFKLYQKPNDKISIRSFCTNSGASYVAEEVTYNMKSYNGHSYKNRPDTGFVNFGIIMEVKGIDEPFEFQKNLVNKCQINIDNKNYGIYFSPDLTLDAPKDAEGNKMNIFGTGDISLVKELFGEYFQHIWDYIQDLNKVFKFDNEYGIFVPEVKYLSEEVKVNYEGLSLIQYPHIHFCGDSLSARGIIVSQSQAMAVSDAIIKELK